MSRQNVVFALLVLAALIPLAVTGIVTVAVAVIAHEGSELLAVANGLRVGRAGDITNRARKSPVRD